MVQLRRAVYDAMIEHALAERPFECCGMLAGADGPIERIYPTENAADLKGVRYEIAPRDMLRISREIDDDDLELRAVYHSHPFTRAYPSATDVGLGGWDVVYVIVGLVDFRNPVVKAYTIADGEVAEEPIEVI